MTVHQSSKNAEVQAAIGRRAYDRRIDGRYFMHDEWADARWDRGSCKAQVIELSATGLMIEADCDAKVDERMTVQLGGCNPVSCSVRWTREGRLGLEYAEETEVLGEAGVVQFYIDNVSGVATEQPPVSGRRDGQERRERTLRLYMLRAATLGVGDYLQPVHVRNISSEGAMLALDEPIENEKGKAAVLDLGPAGQVDAKICWAAGCELGLEFTDDFDIGKLNQQ